MDCQKAVLIFLKNFLDSRSDTVEKHSIINLCSQRNVSYAFRVLSDYEEKGEDAAFSPFVYYVLVTQIVA